MNKKAQELELRNIMQGLEEFATFMSFKGNSVGLRVLSVESVESVVQPESIRTPKKQTAQIIKMPERLFQPNPHKQQSLNRQLSFQDRDYH